MIQGVDEASILNELNWLKSNFKQYVAGNTYNGVALTVTGTNWTTVRAVFIPYKTTNGDWRLIFNIYGSLSVTTSSIDVIISGIVTKNIALYYQAVSVTHFQSAYSSGYVFPVNSNRLRLYAGSNSTSWAVSGDIELDSKPTWAD